jgi:hypothetical protein
MSDGYIMDYLLWYSTYESIIASVAVAAGKLAA